MNAVGFMPTGKDFPVFLQPVTKVGYAVAAGSAKATRTIAVRACRSRWAVFDSSCSIPNDVSRMTFLG
jgi:hypothetical protein